MSLLDIVEEITVFKVMDIPEGAKVAIPLNMTIVSMLWRSDLKVPETGSLRIQLMSPTGETIELEQPPLVEINLTGAFKRFRSRVGFQGLPFVGNGVYRFMIQLQSGEDSEWETVGNVPLEINTQADPQE